MPIFYLESLVAIRGFFFVKPPRIGCHKDTKTQSFWSHMRGDHLFPPDSYRDRTKQLGLPAEASRVGMARQPRLPVARRGKPPTRCRYVGAGADGTRVTPGRVSLPRRAFCESGSLPIFSKAPCKTRGFFIKKYFWSDATRGSPLSLPIAIGTEQSS